MVIIQKATWGPTRFLFFSFSLPCYKYALNFQHVQIFMELYPAPPLKAFSYISFIMYSRYPWVLPGMCSNLLQCFHIILQYIPNLSNTSKARYNHLIGIHALFSGFFLRSWECHGSETPTVPVVGIFLMNSYW